MSGQLAKGSVVWAKLRGSPWWPARIRSHRPAGIRVVFYGTKDSSVLPASAVVPFGDRLELCDRPHLGIDNGVAKKGRLYKLYQVGCQEARAAADGGAEGDDSSEDAAWSEDVAGMAEPAGPATLATPAIPATLTTPGPAAAPTGMAAVRAMLVRFRLADYADQFEEQGYDDANFLLRMGASAIDALGRDCKMKVGHLKKFKHMLEAERAEQRR